MDKYCNERNTCILYYWYVQQNDLPKLSSWETENKSFSGEYLYAGLEVVCFLGSETSVWKSWFVFV